MGLIFCTSLGLSEWFLLLQYTSLFFTIHLTLIPLFILLNNSLCFYGNELHLSVQAGSCACVFSKFPAPLNSIASVLRDSLWAVKHSNALESLCKLCFVCWQLKVKKVGCLRNADADPYQIPWPSQGKRYLRWVSILSMWLQAMSENWRSWRYFKALLLCFNFII